MLYAINTRFTRALGGYFSTHTKSTYITMVVVAVALYKYQQYLRNLLVRGPRGFD